MVGLECFLCLTRLDTVQCGQCGSGLCYRHRAVHTGQAGIGSCVPYRVQDRGGGEGRVLVATRLLRPGELIWRESPAVVGPYSRSGAQCLECRRLAPASSCPGCGYPTCGPACAAGPLHRLECAVLARRPPDCPARYEAVTVLRLLLRLEREQEAVAGGRGVEPGPDYLLCLAGSLLDHNRQRQQEQPELWAWEQEAMVEFLHSCGLADRFTAEQIHSASGKILMNATSLEVPGDTELGRWAGLYPIYSLMNTSCCNNTRSTVLPDNTVEVRAKRRIRPGQEITNQYLKPDQPSHIRRPLMRQKWFFDCGCQRCLDPTELGSHWGSVLCRAGRGVARCGGAVVTTSTLDSGADWACQQCGAVLSLHQVTTVLSSAERVIASPASGDGPVEHYERVLHLLSADLHPGNFLLVGVKLKLALLLGNLAPHSLAKLSTPGRQRKAQLCVETAARLARYPVVPCRAVYSTAGWRAGCRTATRRC